MTVYYPKAVVLMGIISYGFDVTNQLRIRSFAFVDTGEEMGVQ
jgi:hypothetical protein